MLVELYVEALLVEPKAADLIWEAWAAGELSDFVAAWAWLQVASMTASPSKAAVEVILRLRSANDPKGTLCLLRRHGEPIQRLTVLSTDTYPADIC